MKHELEDVLRIALIGVLCSCDDYDEISDLIEDRAEEFREMGFLKLANGVLSGDTIRRVVESVDPDQMRASLSVCRDRIEKGHGRQEKRTCSIPDTRQLEQEGLYEEWPGLKRIIRIDRERTCDGRKTNDTIYYVSSKESDEASYFAARIRDHWKIENKLHWHLDVTFREDQCRVSTKNGAVNLSILRKFAMELLKKQDDKLSLKRRRKKCMRDPLYLAKIIIEG